MIWVVGARGMLGREVVKRLEALGLAHVDTDLECDITDPEAVSGFASARRIDWIVNCSGYTAVDRAETEEAKADAVNAVGVGNLGSAAAREGARVIHVSTDYVFDGIASNPYREDTPVAPRGAYGRTKARGEALLLQAAPQCFIVRTAWLFGAGGANFVRTMLRLMNEREEVSVVDDQRGTPTYARDLAGAICSIVAADSRAFGIYHYTNDGQTTWFEFASRIYERGRALGLIRHACNVVPISTDRYPTAAVRPKYSVLSKDKIKRTFGLEIPTWQDALERFLEELREEVSS